MRNAHTSIVMAGLDDPAIHVSTARMAPPKAGCPGLRPGMTDRGVKSLAETR